MVDALSTNRILYVKMLLFVGRAGVPMEVMGLMLGQFVDEYTITCVDVFAMPQVCFCNRVNYDSKYPHNTTSTELVLASRR